VKQAAGEVFTAKRALHRPGKAPALGLRAGGAGIILEQTTTFTGGTGKFAGASGHAPLACEVTQDPTSPLRLICNGRGSGTLVLVHH
jgi:hypothetical protein